MSYGIIIKKANDQQIADPTTVAGRLFVQRIVQAYNTTQTYTISTVASHTDLIIYTVNQAAHNIVTSTVNGAATITITGFSVPINRGLYGVSTEILVFARNSIEPDYGIATTNNSGQRVVSTVLPCPEFLTSTSVALTGSYTDGLYSGYNLFTYGVSLGSVGANRNRLVLWLLPDDTNKDVWYDGTSYISSSVSTTGISLDILSKNTSAPVAPRAYLFALDGLTASTDGYGIRILNASSQVVFDSGRDHMLIKGITENLYFSEPNYTYNVVYADKQTVSFSVPEYSSVQAPLAYIPNFYKETGIPNPNGSLMSRIYSTRGYCKREGSTLILGSITTVGFEDASITPYSYSYGASGLVTVTADAADYPRTGPIVTGFNINGVNSTIKGISSSSSSNILSPISTVGTPTSVVITSGPAIGSASVSGTNVIYNAGAVTTTSIVNITARWSDSTGQGDPLQMSFRVCNESVTGPPETYVNTSVFITLANGVPNTQFTVTGAENASAFLNNSGGFTFNPTYAAVGTYNYTITFAATGSVRNYSIIVSEQPSGGGY
jgi:hypothetical protein